MRKNISYFIGCTFILITLLSICSLKTKNNMKGSTKIQVFIASSLSGPMEELKTTYEKEHPNVTITYNVDGSGALLTQIQEGYECDVFFSAATKQMDVLEREGKVIAGSRVSLLKNQVVLITAKDSHTKVTGFDNMNLAKNMALAGGSVPVGKYTRILLMNLGLLRMVEDPSIYTSEEIKEALDGIEINECSNASKVTEAVKEGANEIGTVYYSDAYSNQDVIRIIATAESSMTGDIIYPVAQLENKEADENQKRAAKDFLQYLLRRESKDMFEKYMFQYIK